MRYHELAVQRWLNSIFWVRQGYPVPVCFASPMDAFSHFEQLWGAANNPFSYLLDLKDEQGKPLYQPFPQPIRYPVISVLRKNWKYRVGQNFSIHRWRHINWPTVSDTGDAIYGKQQQGVGLARGDLANVTTSRMPMAWDYRYQIDHYCNRPDTQAFFIEQLMQEFWRTGGTPQTWIKVVYPGWGARLVRLYLDGDVENLTPEEPEEGKNVEFRTSFTVVVEGFDVDLHYEIYPALWTLLLGTSSVDPNTLEKSFSAMFEIDLRYKDNNPVVNKRKGMPDDAKTQRELNPSAHRTSQEVAMRSLVNHSSFGDIA